MASLRSACGAPPRRRSNRDDARERGRVYPTIARGHGAGRLRSRFAVHANGDELKTCRECTPRIPSEPLNVIGIDDWAWRRNHRYGTIVCDLERRQPVALREQATAQAWLVGHPKVVVVARDRGGGMAVVVFAADLRWLTEETAAATRVMIQQQRLHMPPTRPNAAGPARCWRFARREQPPTEAR